MLFKAKAWDGEMEKMGVCKRRGFGRPDESGEPLVVGVVILNMAVLMRVLGKMGAEVVFTAGLRRKRHLLRRDVLFNRCHFGLSELFGTVCSFPQVRWPIFHS
jgi:hypothetical protein